MGNCCNPELNKEVELAIEKLDLSLLKEILNNQKGDSSSSKFDIYKHDTVSKLLCRTLPSSAVSSKPILEFLTEYVTNNNNSNLQKSKYKTNPPNCYLTLIAKHNPFDISAFRFILDNSDIFPIKSEIEGNNNKKNNNNNNNNESCPPILHELASRKNKFKLLQEFLSSGSTIIDRFKNVNNSDDSMRRGEVTPIQLACFLEFNTDSVLEMVVNGVGGKNYTQCIEKLLTKTKSGGAGSDEDAFVQIVLAMMSQQNSEEIKSFVSKNAELRVNMIKFRPANKVRDVDEEQLKEYFADGFTFATVAFFLGLEELYRVLVKNGCKKGPHEKTIQIMNAADVDNPRTMEML